MVTQDTRGRLVTHSKNVAEVTGNQHFHVIRDIDALRESHPNLDGFMFQEVTAFDPAANRDVMAFEMTRDGMALLVMGYTTPRAMEFKLAFLAKCQRVRASIL